MNNEDKIFDLMTKMYSGMQEGFKEVNDKINKLDNRLSKVENRLSKVENRLSKVEKTVIDIENNHGAKLDALFDGYKQNSDKLDRIEAEVSKHEEIIIKKIK